ncbi:unnamed protein product [Acidithrix sp. C25]|nr:unnamed protein product [Acidithrix sp. C25]
MIYWFRGRVDFFGQLLHLWRLRLCVSPKVVFGAFGDGSSILV